MDAGDWHDQFVRRFEDALEKHTWLPIYRASHGEFSFVSGRREVPRSIRERLRYYVSRVYRVLRFQSTFYSGTPGYGYETYKQWELPRLRRKLAQQIKSITEEGVVCYYFSDRDTFPLTEQQDFANWVVHAGGSLQAHNYGHIYFVYGLFHRDGWEKYFEGKRLLIVSSDQPERTSALKEVLLRLKVKSWRFIPISRSHSMRDTIECPSDYDPDLCIVGAGVGAANVIWQLRGLSCPCVDAGFVLDTLAFPAVKKQRIYCINDEEWNKCYDAETPKWAPKFLDEYSIIP